MIFKTLNFIILAVVLYFVLKKPLREFFASRSATIRLAVSEAEKVYATAVNQHEIINQKLEKLELQAAQLTKNLEEEGKMERSRLIEAAKGLAEKIKEDSKKMAEAELKRVKEELRETAIGLAFDLARQKIREEVKTEDQEKFNQGFVDRMRRLH